MSAYCEFLDISVSGLDWVTPDRTTRPATVLPETRYPQGGFRKAYCLTQNSNYGWINKNEPSDASDLLFFTALHTQPLIEESKVNVSNWQCSTPTSFIADIALSKYLREFDSLPASKQYQIILTVGQINGEILEMELDEDDGQIVIRTLENGLKCFYAICTEQRDFKGTWLPNGSLLTQPWSAIPRYEALYQRLI